jgi:hypothetical protein
MIKSNELRLGNFVKDRGNKVIRIDFLEHIQKDYQTKFGQLIFLEGTEVHPMTEYTDYALPIELSETNIVKLGFSVSQEGWYELIKAPLVFTWNIYDKTFRFAGYSFAEIKFVHQVQNAVYSLTGSELEVVW